MATAKLYDPSNWYWIVGGSTTDVYSSAAVAYVLVSDATYVAWLATDPYGWPAIVADEAELWLALASTYPQGIPVGSAAGQATIANLRTFQDNYFTLKDNLDPTKQLRWQLSGIATATIRTWTVPDASDTVVLNNEYAGLSNKYFNTPVVIYNPSTGNPYAGVSGNKVGGNQWYMQTVDDNGRWRLLDATGGNLEKCSVSQGSLATASFTIPMTTPSTSNTTGALLIGGGLGVTGAVYAQSDIRSSNGALGYTGGGANVTQTGSITTTVAVGYFSGTITTVSSTLAAAAEATFTVTHASIQATDVAHVCMKSYAGAGQPQPYVSRVAAGQFDITITNLGTAALNAAMAINYIVFKGGAST